uniref:Putative ATPase domain containing protein n=1 Tax=viral metagenome TaxID=1070528 RepID=A0A6M3KX34_9ZZZZ
MTKELKKNRAIETLQQIQKEMKTHFLEMDDVIEGLLVGLIAEQNVLLIGPPGSAKTQISKFIAKSIGGEFFDHLLTKYTVPDELFGPIDIIAMREKKVFKRVTEHTLATAHIALLDEFWKASSAIINYMLRAANEREFKENGQVIKLPLKMMIGASNEYPTGEETGAMYDRFNLKYETTYIEEDKNFLGLLCTADKDPEPTNNISLPELQDVITRAEALPCPKQILETLTQMRRELKKAGIILSPRRWKKSIRMLKAKAILRGAGKVEDEDIGFLSNVLWNNPEQKPVVTKLIAQVVNPLLQKAMELMDMASEIWRNLENTQGASARGKALLEARAKFASMRKQLLEMKEQTTPQGKWMIKMEEIYEKVSQHQRAVAEELNSGLI